MRPAKIRERLRRDRESGQATTEFALIFIPLMMVVAGIIYFGIGLNYWLDMQRVANQGARWAAVNCTRSAAAPLAYNPCEGGVAGQTLQQTLRKQALTRGLQSSVCVDISFPPTGSGTQDVGDPVKIHLTSPFKLVPILGIRTIQLGAQATMRMEAKPTAFTADATPCP